MTNQPPPDFRLPAAPETYDRFDQEQLRQIIEQRLDDQSSAISIDWNVTNYGTPRKEIDFASATATEVREVLATLIKVMQDRGILG